MTDLVSRPLGVNSNFGVLHDAVLAAGGIVIDQDAYTSGLDRVYDVRGLKNMHVEITNFGATENGLTYKIEKARKTYDLLTDLTDLDFDIDIKADTNVTPGTLADGTVTCVSVQENVFGTGTATLLGVGAGDTVTVNGLLYTAVSGTAVEGEFDIDGGTDTLDAVELKNAINIDTRSGTIGDASATNAAAIVTFTTDVAGTAGNATTLAETGTTITISGATFTGGLNVDTVTVNGLLYTAVAGARANDTQFSTDTGDNETATDLAAAITADTRTGTLNDVVATATTNVVTCESTVVGVASNAITLASNDGTSLAVSGATFANATEPVDSITNVIDVSPESTAIRIRVKRQTSGQDTTLKGVVSFN